MKNELHLRLGIEHMSLFSFISKDFVNNKAKIRNLKYLLEERLKAIQKLNTITF